MNDDAYRDKLHENQLEVRTPLFRSVISSLCLIGFVLLMVELVL
jgi:hypothetical protein